MNKPDDVLVELVGIGCITECKSSMRWVETGRVDSSGYVQDIHIKGDKGEGVFDKEHLDKYIDYSLTRGSLMRVSRTNAVIVKEWRQYLKDHSVEIAEIENLTNERDKLLEQSGQAVRKIDEDIDHAKKELTK